MASQQGWYWIGVGMLALGLTNNLADTRGDWTRDIANKLRNAVEEASGQAVAYWDRTESTWSDRKADMDEFAAPVVRVTQARIACANLALARRQAAWARLETARTRMLKQRVRHVTVSCPGQNFVIDVPPPRVVVDDNF